MSTRDRSEKRKPGPVAVKLNFTNSAENQQRLRKVYRILLRPIARKNKEALSQESKTSRVRAKLEEESFGFKEGLGQDTP